MIAVYGTIAMGVVAALMIFALRHRNGDYKAGRGVAAWTIVIIIIIWIASMEGVL